jgi:hypothetical protein
MVLFALILCALASASALSLNTGSKLNLAMDNGCPMLTTPAFSSTLEVADLCMG